MQDKITGSSYILTLYRDIEYINEYLPAYKTALLTIEQKTASEGKQPEDVLINIRSEEKDGLLEVTNTIRFLLIRTYVKISSLSQNFKSFEKFSKENKTKYDEIISKPFPNYEDLTEYIISLNKVFISSVAQEFLKDAKEIYSQYMEQEKENQTEKEEIKQTEKETSNYEGYSNLIG